MSRGSSFSFAQVPRADIPRSTFNRNHGYKTTFDSGYLVPFFVDEALPGDTFHVKVNAFARLATPIVPIMDNLYMDMFFFAVPNRLVWSNWQKFMGEQANPGDSIDYVIPKVQCQTTSYQYESLQDYFGIPPVSDLVTGGVPYVSALPFRAYNLIWNEWFRDQNLQTSLVVPKNDGPDNSTDYVLKRRGKRHDYFTSCLPWPQKGPGVDIPLTGNVPVMTGANAHGLGTHDPILWRQATGVNVATNVDVVFGAVNGRMEPSSGAATGTGTGIYPTNLYANVGDAVGTINDLRTAFQLQRLLERDARGGTRYVEILKSHFGVTSPDARLQRPEYLGGSSTPVNINPVAQTSETATGSPQGNLAGYGVVSARGGFTKSFVEHCTLIGLVSVRADMSYSGGINRMWSRSTRYDFYWPALSHLGEQAVLKKELGHTGSMQDPNAIFGYQERWAEYRYKETMITGKFRNSYPQTLDVWHLAQDLSGASLNSAFIEENPPVDRIIAVPTEPHFLFDSHFQVKCARPMPMYSVPGLADHF